jgi:5'-3' exonuclease
MAMVTTAELGLDLVAGTAGCGRLPLDEEAVRATYSRFELHVPSAIRALTLREPTRTVTEPYVDPRWKAIPRPRVGPLPKLIPAPAGPAYVQEALF